MPGKGGGLALGSAPPQDADGEFPPLPSQGSVHLSPEPAPQLGGRGDAPQLGHRSGGGSSRSSLSPPPSGILLAPDREALEARARPRSRDRSGSRPRVPVEAAATHGAWAGLFKTSSSSSPDLRLEFFPPLVNEGQNLAVYEAADSEELEGFWSCALVGHVIGLKTAFNPLMAYIKSRWRPQGFELFMLDNGFFVCKLDLEEDLQRILEEFWTIRGHPMILRRWTPSVRLELESLSEIPVWISIHGLPLHLWTRRFIGKLCSTIGEPLYLDRLTAERKRLSFAKACVIVSAEKELPDMVSFQDQDGTKRKLHITYAWKPQRCSTCSAFGHLYTGCALTARKQDPGESSILVNSQPTNPHIHKGRQGGPPNIGSMCQQPQRQNAHPTAGQTNDHTRAESQHLSNQRKELIQDHHRRHAKPADDSKQMTHLPMQGVMGWNPETNTPGQTNSISPQPPTAQQGCICPQGSPGEGGVVPQEGTGVVPASHSASPISESMVPVAEGCGVSQKGTVDSDDDGSSAPHSRFSALLAVDEIEWKNIKPAGGHSCKGKGKNKIKPKGPT